MGIIQQTQRRRRETQETKRVTQDQGRFRFDQAPIEIGSRKRGTGKDTGAVET